MQHIVEGWMSRFPTRDDALEALQRFRVPCAPVLSLAEAMAHPHMRVRGSVRTVDDPLLGRFAIPGPPVRYSAWPMNAEPKAPLLGQDNGNVLRDVAGLSDVEIKALYDDGVLVHDTMLKAEEAGAA